MTLLNTHFNLPSTKSTLLEDGFISFDGKTNQTWNVLLPSFINSILPYIRRRKMRFGLISAKYFIHNHWSIVRPDMKNYQVVARLQNWHLSKTHDIRLRMLWNNFACHFSRELHPRPQSPRFTSPVSVFPIQSSEPLTICPTSLIGPVCGLKVKKETPWKTQLWTVTS